MTSIGRILVLFASQQNVRVSNQQPSLILLCRLMGSDAEGALEADVARLSTLQEQRESKSRLGDRREHASKDTPVEIMQLRCVVEEKDRDLAAMNERILTLQVCVRDQRTDLWIYKISFRLCMCFGPMDATEQLIGLHCRSDIVCRES